MKRLSFDLHGTLVTYRHLDYFWMELIPRIYAEENGISLENAKRKVYQLYEAVGPQDLRWYLPGYWISLLDLHVELSVLLEECRRLVEPYPDAIEAVQQLKGKYRLVILTNASSEFVELVLKEIAEFRDSFRAHYSSVTHFNLVQKTEEFYRRVLEAEGVSPAEFIHVGDDKVFDGGNFHFQLVAQG